MVQVHLCPPAANKTHILQYDSYPAERDQARDRPADGGITRYILSGYSSAGRMLASQARDRRFESGYPLQFRRRSSRRRRDYLPHLLIDLVLDIW